MYRHSIKIHVSLSPILADSLETYCMRTGTQRSTVIQMALVDWFANKKFWLSKADPSQSAKAIVPQKLEGKLIFGQPFDPVKSLRITCLLELHWKRQATTKTF